MEHTDTPPPLDELPEFVAQVERILSDARELLAGLDIDHFDSAQPENEDSDAKAQNVEQLQGLLSQSDAHNIEIAEVHTVFISWESSEIPAVEKSEVVRALGLIKRANVVTQNSRRILREALGLPDPERQQAELEMQLRSMGVIRG